MSSTVRINSITGTFPNFQASNTIEPDAGRGVGTPPVKTKDEDSTVLTYGDIPGNGDPFNVLQDFTAYEGTTSLTVIQDGGEDEGDWG